MATAKKFNLLQIGTADRRGGAAYVSWQLKTAVEKIGGQAPMLVADKSSNAENVKLIPRSRLRKWLGIIFASDSLYRTDWIIDTEEFRRADLVHCHNLHGRFFNLKTLAKISNIKPTIWTLHDEWAITSHCAYTFESEKMTAGFWDCPSLDTPERILWPNEKHLRQFKEKVYQKSKLNIVTPSRWLYERVHQSLLGNQNLILIPNGVDTSTFKPEDKLAARKEFSLPTDKKIVLFLADAGKINPWKGWEFTEKIINHFSDHREILFVCAGNDLPERAKENIVYLPLIKEPEKLARLYNAADVLLYSSVADNFPLVILEAMACGLPIAAFNTGGIGEALTHQENGYLARYRDEQDLTAGLSALLNLSTEECLKMTERSVRKIKEFYSLELMLSRYEKLYRSLLS